MSGTWEIRQGDCLEAMAEMPEASVDAIVTDPPYGLNFMGKHWDNPAMLGQDNAPPGGGSNYFKRKGDEGYTPGNAAWYGHGDPPREQEWHYAWATEALRVLKPGGHLLAFGGTRTSHRLVCAIEDAGFEIRDSIAFLHTKVSKPIDILVAWQHWSETVSPAGVRFARNPTEAGPSTPLNGSAPEPVLLSTSLKNSPADATVAELSLSEAHRTDAASWRSVLEGADATTTESSALVTIAGSSPASPEAKPSTEDSSVTLGVWDWLSGSTASRLKGAEALRIWLGSGESSGRAATDALCAALTDDLRLITCAHSKTFQSYDTTRQMVCVSATNVTTTASTAASLIAFTVATHEAEGGDAREASAGPLAWVYGSGFP